VQKPKPYRQIKQPPIVEIKLCPGLFVKQMALEAADSWVPQHSHAFAHLSMVAAGKVAVWRDGQFWGDFEAPTGILIEPGVKHTFHSLVPHTVIYCIHRVGADGEPEILEEHQFGTAL
jgi:hypothetical protein